MKALIYDLGLFSPCAEELARSPLFDEIWYFTPTHEQFPISRKALIGAGLEGVKRIYRFFDYVEAADVIVFPDVGLGDLQTYLRSQGKAVWGSGEGEMLELERAGLKSLMESRGMKVPKWSLIDGMDDLRSYFEDPSNDDQFVKISRFRGDAETFHHKDWFRSEPWWADMNHRLGPMRDLMEFVAEAKIEGVEVGFDGICIDGEFPQGAVLGYEDKDHAYVGAVLPYDSLPEPLIRVNVQLAPVLKTLGVRSAYSTELRITRRDGGTLIDPCMRFGSPPSECLWGLYSNWGEIISGGAQGRLVEPKPTARFAAEVILTSSWAEEEWLAVRIPDEVRDQIKLYNHCRIGDVDHVVPGLAQIGAACGVGSTLEEAIESATTAAQAVEAHQLTYDSQAFDRLRETIEKGQKEGISWPS